MRAGCDACGVADAGAGVAGHLLPGSGDPPDGVVPGVGEPQCPIGAFGDPGRAADARPGVDGDVSFRGDPPDGAVAVVGKPQRPAWPGGDVERLADAGGGEVGHHAGGGDPPDGVVAVVGEPHVPVWPCGDPVRVVDPGAGEGGERPGRADPPDRPAGAADRGKPHVPASARRDPFRVVGGRDLGAGSGGGDPADVTIHATDRVPQVPVPAGRDVGRAVSRWVRDAVAGDHPRGRDLPDRRGVAVFGEPHVSVWPGGDSVRVDISAQRIFSHMTGS